MRFEKSLKKKVFYYGETLEWNGQVSLEEYEIKNDVRYRFL